MHKDSSFFNNVIKLMTGTVIAQIIPIAITPLLSRYFAPEDFGVFAIFTSITSILVVFATGKLELAIMLPENDRDSYQIVLVIIGLSIILSATTLLILIIGNEKILSLIGLSAIGKFKFILPLSVFLTSINLALKYLKNRKQSFIVIRNITIWGALTRGSSNIIISLTNPFHIGLIISQLVSLLISAFLWFRNEINLIINQLLDFTVKDLLNTLRRHIKIIYYLVPGGLINTFAVQMPVFLIAYFYNEGVVGQFSMAQRLISIPLVFIMTAFSDTFRQKASDIFRETGSNREVFLKNVKRLTLIGIIPFMFLFFLAPFFFRVFLGNQWIQAGKITKILALMFYIKFIFSGLSAVVIQVSEKYEYEIIYQVLFLLLSTSGFIIGHFVFENIYYSLGFYSLGAIIMYILSFLIAYRFSIKRGRQQK